MSDNNKMNKEKFIELCKCGETSHVQFKQGFTSQVKIAQEMVAFANSAYSGRYPFTNSGDIRSLRW